MIDQNAAHHSRSNDIEVLAAMNVDLAIHKAYERFIDQGCGL